MNTTTLRKGDVVEFETSYPGHEGETVRAVVFSPADGCYLFSTVAMAPFGQVEVDPAKCRVVDHVSGWGR